MFKVFTWHKFEFWPCDHYTMTTVAFHKDGAFSRDVFSLGRIADLMQPCKADLSVWFIIFMERQWFLIVYWPSAVHPVHLPTAFKETDPVWALGFIKWVWCSQRAFPHVGFSVRADVLMLCGASLLTVFPWAEQTGIASKTKALGYWKLSLLYISTIVDFIAWEDSFWKAT